VPDLPAPPVVPALPEPLPASPALPPVPPPAGVTLPQPASNNIDPTETEAIHPGIRIAMIYGRRGARLKHGIGPPHADHGIVSCYAQLRYCLKGPVSGFEFRELDHLESCLF
jgi:hypothetical protein